MPAVVWAATVAVGALAAAWSVVLPLAEGPDEPSHLGLVLHLADGGGYPAHDGLARSVAVVRLCTTYAAAVRVCPVPGEVVTADALDAKVAELVRALVSAGPAAMKACKRLVHEVAGHPITDALVEATVEQIADIRASAEGREGVQSFLGKRKPQWLLPQ